MPETTRESLTLHWDEAGPVSGPPILLIMGLGAQMIAWRPGFVDLLVAQGYRVLRFDNRDSGLSDAIDHRVPEIGDLARIVLRGDRAMAPYLLSDMAQDAVAVLDAAGVEAAHVVGASMGGMIAQQLAIDEPARVRSLTSIMSRPGSRWAGLPSAQIARIVTTPAPSGRDGQLAHELARQEAIAGPLFDRAAMAAFLEESFERNPDRSGTPRQLAAIMASPDRTPGLRKLAVPSLVIHGRQDRLVRLSGGHATARAIPGSELLVVDRMGHDLPVPLWPLLTDAIGGHIRRVERSSLNASA
ncbi:MAG: alpha/beta fold hydrolase [Actinobacteria bacterium]|nr:alpha/beta fold hydrolase [Actinomycetota bacterium]